MPELPEVETTRRGIAPHLIGRRVTGVILRRPDLRWPIPVEISELLPGQRINAVERRAKYLLLHTEVGSALLHLGMSGVLRVLPPDAPVGKHDHVDIALERTPAQAPRILRFTDPRRFGCLLWQPPGPRDLPLERTPVQAPRILRFTDPRRFGCLLWQPPGETHALLDALGPEPLTDDFDGDLLWRLSRGRRAAVKLFLMDNAIVVGVGNIYASEALFAAGIDPRRAAGNVSRVRYSRLAAEVKRILAWAIERGGTTLRDFLNPDGAPGYFFRELNVYGRAGEACRVCGTPIRQIVLGQRSTFWCPHCQH